MTAQVAPRQEPISSSHPHLYFETDRLLVRQYTLCDIEPLFQVMSDCRVHTYTKDKDNPWNMQRTGKYVKFIIDQNFQTLDCFHGAVIEKSTNHLIGLCGLNPYRPDEPEIEFKIGVSHWGKGYATELAKQIVRDAFATTNIKGIYGMAQPDNVASRRVLEKTGMTYIGIQVFRNHEDAFYYIGHCK